MLTENEVARIWGKIFGGGGFGPDDFDRAELLLDDLRPESPLRHRLTIELEELRNLHTHQLAVATQNS